MTESTKETIEDKKRQDQLAKRVKMQAIYQAEKEIRSVRIECACGAMLRNDGRHRHVRTEKHQRFIQGLEPKQPLTEREKMLKDLEQVPCACGGSYRRCHKTKHFWTNQHKKWLREWMDNCSDTDTEEGVPEFRPKLL